MKSIAEPNKGSRAPTIALAADLALNLDTVLAPVPALCTYIHMLQRRTRRAVARFGASVPMKRPAQPEEIAPSIVFFASSIHSSYITGEVLALLGGETIAA